MTKLEIIRGVILLLLIPAVSFESYYTGKAEGLRIGDVDLSRCVDGFAKCGKDYRELSADYRRCAFTLKVCYEELPEEKRP